MEDWIRESLSKLLNFPIEDDFVRCILQMENERDLDEFLKTLLNSNDPKHRQFIAELKKQQAYSKDQSRQKKTNDNVNKKQNDKKKGKAKPKEAPQPQESSKPEKVEKKKTKFVNLYSEEGQERAVVFLKGRHKCDCEARRHNLINNCLNCGRIVCRQEGSGPCFVCGTLVCYPDQQLILSGNSKQADNLYNKLMNQKPSKSIEESIKQRDKLLEYDRNSTQCTKVIDDESDYYQSNNTWLTAQQRELVKKQEEELATRKHASRLNRKMTFDFTGRQIIEENEPIEDISEEQFQSLCESIPFDELETTNNCPTIEFDRPTYIELSGSKSSPVRGHISSSMRSRIQDKEFLEISDLGLCLSMHQPYASLLVAGIKIHEGRTWYSSHRGRLWIAATAKVPSAQDISSMQQFYRVLKNEKIKFPEHYPSGCLLGCVTVVDVLSQEEYRKQYPEGESESPYVFICENFYTLPIKFPIKGMHKIYKLDPKIHQAAVKSLQKAIKIKNV